MPPKRDTVRFTVSLPAELLDEVDARLEKQGYASRSEFIRDMVRERLVTETWEADREVLGTLTIVFDHETRQLGRRLTAMQHDHHGLVMASTHVHLSQRLCAEMIMLRGRASRIRALADRLGQQKGVLHAALSLSSAGEALA